LLNLWLVSKGIHMFHLVASEFGATTVGSWEVTNLLDSPLNNEGKKWLKWPYLHHGCIDWPETKGAIFRPRY
jgi:hypothetical protein